MTFPLFSQSSHKISNSIGVNVFGQIASVVAGGLILAIAAMLGVI